MRHRQVAYVCSSITISIRCSDHADLLFEGLARLPAAATATATATSAATATAMLRPPLLLLRRLPPLPAAASTTAAAAAAATASPTPQDGWHNTISPSQLQRPTNDHLGHTRLAPFVPSNLPKTLVLNLQISLALLQAQRGLPHHKVPSENKSMLLYRDEGPEAEAARWPEAETEDRATPKTDARARTDTMRHRQVAYVCSSIPISILCSAHAYLLFEGLARLPAAATATATAASAATATAMLRLPLLLLRRLPPLPAAASTTAAAAATAVRCSYYWRCCCYRHC